MNGKERKAAAKAARAAKAEPVVTKTAAEANSKLSEFAAKKREQAEKAQVVSRGTGLPSLPRLPRKAKDKPLRACECGCGGTTKSRFFPGHDGRTKGWILRIDRGVVKIAQVPDGERQVVEAALRERDGDETIDALIAEDAASEEDAVADDEADDDEAEPEEEEAMTS